MSLAVWYWLFLVLALVGGAWWHYQPGGPTHLAWGNSILLFILLALLGIAVFGSPIK